MGRPDSTQSTQAPILVWSEHEEGLQSSAGPPPYRLNSPANTRPTASGPSSHQEYAYDRQSPMESSHSRSNAGAASESSSLFELDAGESLIPPPGDTGVTSMYVVSIDYLKSSNLFR